MSIQLDSVIRTNVSTYNRQLCLIHIYRFSIALSNIYRQITNYVEINRATCAIISWDKYIDWMQITSRYVSINVDVSYYRWFKLRKDAVLNKFTSTHCYNYPYLLEYNDLLQTQSIQIPRFISIQLDLQLFERIY